MTLGGFLFIQPVSAATTDMDLAGYAWANVPQDPVGGPSTGTGWISFNCSNAGVCATSNYKVSINGTSGLMSGYAWSENLGWLSFETGDLSGCPSGTCEARYDSVSKTLSGWARFLSAGDGSQGWDGWMRLNGTGYQVTYNSTTQEFSNWSWGHNLAGWISWNCNNENVCGASNYKVTTTGGSIILEPPTVEVGSPAVCARTTLNITDDSIGEEQFVVYRDNDSNFDNGKTYLATITSTTTAGQGTQYQYTDDLSSILTGPANYYYHVVARTADNLSISTPTTVGPVSVSPCPLEISSRIQISSIQRGSETITPPNNANNCSNEPALDSSVILRKGDVLTLDLYICNTTALTANDVNVTMNLTPNLVYQNNSMVNSRYGGGFQPTFPLYSNNVLDIPASGSFGNMTQGTWQVRFKATVNSSEPIGTILDRFNAWGTVNYTYLSTNFTSAFNMGYRLFYLISTRPIQFQEK